MHEKINDHLKKYKLNLTRVVSAQKFTYLMSNLKSFDYAQRHIILIVITQFNNMKYSVLTYYTDYLCFQETEYQ